MEESLQLIELEEAIERLLSTEITRSLLNKALNEGKSLQPSLWPKFAELGWMGLTIDEAYGGVGLGFTELAALYHVLGRHLAPLPVLTTMVAIDAVKLFGSETQKELYLPKFATGDLSATIALTQTPDSIPDVRLTNDSFTINGAVRHVIDADIVDCIFVQAASDDGGLGFAVLSPQDDGVCITRAPNHDATRRICHIEFDCHGLSKENWFSLQSSIPDSAVQLANHARLGIACDSIGGASRIFEKTVEYMKIREQFGRPIGSFQALKHRAASLKIRLEAASGLCGHTAVMLASGADDSALWACSAKFYACDTFVTTAEEAIQLHGGIGYTWEHDCHLFLKRARLNQALFGSSVAHKETVAELAFRTD